MKYFACDFYESDYMRNTNAFRTRAKDEIVKLEKDTYGRDVSHEEIEIVFGGGQFLKGILNFAAREEERGVVVLARPGFFLGWPALRVGAAGGRRYDARRAAGSDAGIHSDGRHRHGRPDRSGAGAGLPVAAVARAGTYAREHSERRGALSARFGKLREDIVFVVGVDDVGIVEPNELFAVFIDFVGAVDIDELRTVGGGLVHRIRVDDARGELFEPRLLTGRNFLTAEIFAEVVEFVGLGVVKIGSLIRGRFRTRERTNRTRGYRPRFFRLSSVLRKGGSGGAHDRAQRYRKRRFE